MKFKLSSIIIFLIFALTIFFVYFLQPGFLPLIWQHIEKVGAAATALALWFAIRQSAIAQQTAVQTEKANQENLFQQMFNLILEQHNSELLHVKNWIAGNGLTQHATYAGLRKQLANTQTAIDNVRGHVVLSPYMRILHHTLKIIITKHSSIPNDRNTFKVYTSLVRSFVPNDVLKLIAINTILTNDSYQLTSDTEQYRDYHNNLKACDFFEHLIIGSKNCTFDSFMDQFLKNIDTQFYNKIMNTAGLKTAKNDHLTGSNLVCHDENIQQECIDSIFMTTDLCIALNYELPKKYITLDDHYNEKESFAQNINTALLRKLDTLALDTLTAASSDIYAKHIAFRIGYIYTKPNTHMSMTNHLTFKAFYHGSSSSLLTWIRENVTYAHKSDELKAIKNSLAESIPVLVAKSANIPQEDEGYNDSFDYIVGNLIPDIAKLIDEIIALHAIMADRKRLELILNTIKYKTLSDARKYLSHLM